MKAARRLLLLLPVLAYSIAASGQTPEKTADKPSAVRPFEKLVVDSALVTVIEQVEVPARVEGVLAELNGREGQLVTAGDVLARLEDAEPVLTLRRATLEYDIARKQAKSDIRINVAKKGAELAAVEVRRARESVDKVKKSVSDAEMDRLRLAAEKAILDVDQAVHDQQVADLTMQLKETERQLAEAAVERRRIVAPLPGMIVQVHKHRGDWIDPGKTVLRMLRVDQLRIEALGIKNITGDPAGRRTTLTVDLPGRPAAKFEGVVVFVSPEVTPVDQRIRVWAEVENRDLALRPGLQGKLTIYPDMARTARRNAP